MYVKSYIYIYSINKIKIYINNFVTSRVKLINLMVQ